MAEKLVDPMLRELIGWRGSANKTTLWLHRYSIGLIFDATYPWSAQRAGSSVLRKPGMSIAVAAMQHRRKPGRLPQRPECCAAGVSLDIAWVNDPLSLAVTKGGL